MIKKLSAFALALSYLLNGATVNASIILQEDDGQTVMVSETASDETKGETVEETNENNTNEPSNTIPGSVRVYTVNSSGEALEDVGYRITDDSYTIYSSWVSGTESYSIELQPGNYKLVEISCPDGYVSLGNEDFTIVSGQETVIPRIYSSSFINQEAIDAYGSVEAVIEAQTDSSSGSSETDGTVTEKTPILSKSPVTMKSPLLLGAGNTTKIIDGTSFNNKLVSLINNSSGITEFKKSSVSPSVTINAGDTGDISADQDASVVMWEDAGIIYWYSSVATVYLNENASRMFANANIQAVDMTGIDTSLTTNMTSMFFGSNVETLDLSGFNMAGITSISYIAYMFGSCNSLKTLILSDTSFGSDLSRSILYARIPSTLVFRHTLTAAGTDTGDTTVYTSSDMGDMTASQLSGTWELPTYTVSYDKGRWGIQRTVPEAQTKEHNVNLTLSSQVPQGSVSSTQNILMYQEEDGTYLGADMYGSTVSNTFDNWLYGTTEYAPGDTFDLNEDATLVAQWTTSTQNYGVILPDETKDGYVFLGWYTEEGTYAGAAGDEYFPDPLGQNPGVLYAKFKRAAVTMTLSQEVSGNLGSKDKEFTYFIDLSDGTNGSIDLTDIEYWKNNVQQTLTTHEGSIVVTMSHSDTIQIKNVPIDTIWTVTQDDYTADGYTTSYIVNDGTSQDGRVSTGTVSAAFTVTYTNHKSTSVPTEIRTDLPIAGISVAGLAVILLGLYFARKRLFAGD